MVASSRPRRRSGSVPQLSKRAARSSRRTIRSWSRSSGPVRCRRVTCVRASGAVRVSVIRFSFRPRWAGLKDEDPGKSRGGTGYLSTKKRAMISTLSIELIGEKNWTNTTSLDSVAIAFGQARYQVMCYPERWEHIGGKGRHGGYRVHAARLREQPEDQVDAGEPGRRIPGTHLR